MTVLDSSAVVAMLQGEPGADVVEQRLERGDCSIGAANWSEVAQKVSRVEGAWPLARDLLLGYDLRIESVGREDAEAAASLWRSGSGLSLADRLCIALARRESTDLLSADGEWAGLPGVELIRCQRSRRRRSSAPPRQSSEDDTPGMPSVFAHGPTGP